MLLRIWAIVGAIVCGVGVASLQGRWLPAEAAVVLFAVLLAGVVATLVFKAIEGRRHERPARVEEEPAPPVEDRASTDALPDLIEARDVEWLRVESFEAPWRDDHLAAFRRLVLVDTPHPPEFRRVTGELTEVTKEFLHLYDASTAADPVMFDDVWRVLGQVGPNGETVELDGPDREAAQDRLREAAAMVCTSYDELAVAVRNYVPPEADQPKRTR